MSLWHIRQLSWARFNAAMDRTAMTVTQTEDAYEDALLAARGLFAASVSVEPHEFHSFVHTLDLSRNESGMLGIGFVPAAGPGTVVALPDTLFERADQSKGRPLSPGDLAMLILQSLGLPDSIQAPIQAFHNAQQPSRASTAGHLTGLLRIADLMANGMLLASCESAPVGSLTRGECRTITGEENPLCPDPLKLRSEIYALAGLLARLSPREHAKLMMPLFPASDIPICLVRHPSLSKFDPVTTALQSMAQITLGDRLPASAGDLGNAHALVVISQSTSAVGFTAQDIHKVLTLRDASPLPVLWLVARAEQPAADGPPPLQPVAWPIPLLGLAAFLLEAKPKESASQPAATVAVAA